MRGRGREEAGGNMALSVARSPCPVTGSLCTLRDSSKSARALRSTPGHMKITEVFRVRLLSQQVYVHQRSTQALLLNKKFRKGLSSIFVTQRGRLRAPRTLPVLPAGNHWGPPSQIRNQVGCPSQSPAFGPFGDHRSASRTVNHCPTPVVAPRYVQHFVRTLNG